MSSLDEHGLSFADNRLTIANRTSYLCPTPIQHKPPASPGPGFIYLPLAVLGLRCCTWTFSSCSEQGLLSSCRAWALWWLLLWSTGAQAFSNCSRLAQQLGQVPGFSCSSAGWIFPDQGWNPCPLHWQADSCLLHHRRSPQAQYLNEMLTSQDGLHGCQWTGTGFDAETPPLE